MDNSGGKINRVLGEDESVNKVFEPNTTEELFRGWLLHLHKGRERHDRAARRYEVYRTWLGGSAALFAAVVGTSVFSALVKETSFPVKVAVVALSLLSAILTGLNAFLNLAERTEKHRAAGVQYKALIWRMEQLHVTAGANCADALEKVRDELSRLEMSTPVVAEGIYDRVEQRWRKQHVSFEGEAEKLSVEETQPHSNNG